MAPSAVDSPANTLRACWLGRVEYRVAWALQKRLAAARAADAIADTILLLEHGAVLTLGRGADPGHVRATPAQLATRGIEVITVERGGEVTYHGPGQLVAYPIVRLADRGLLVRPFVRALEAAMVATCARYGVVAARRDGHPGCWCGLDTAQPRKIGALGLRIERGVSYHGIALNVRPDLRDFELIDPCGMPTVVSTSIVAELGLQVAGDQRTPSISVEGAAWAFAASLGSAIGALVVRVDAAALEAVPAFEVAVAS